MEHCSVQREQLLGYVRRFCEERDRLNTITGIHLPPGKFIWFSDLDFAVQAYRLSVGWFGIKPVTYRQMEQALLRCMEAVSHRGDMDQKISGKTGKTFGRG